MKRIFYFFCLRTIIWGAVMTFCSVSAGAAKFSKMYAPTDDGVEVSSFTNKKTYYVVPDVSSTDKECVVLIKSVFEGKQICSDVIVTLKIGSSGSSKGIKTSTFSLYAEEKCQNLILSSQTGDFPTNSTPTEVVYTVREADASFTKDLAIKIAKPVGNFNFVSLHSVKIDFSYNDPTEKPVDLTTIAIDGVVGNRYTVTNVNVAGKFEAGGKHYLAVKDTEKAVRNFSSPANGDKFFKIDGHNQQEYEQNNWMLLTVSAERYNQMAVGKKLTSVTGVLTEKVNLSFETTNLVLDDAEASSFTPNAYCPVNFMGESRVAAVGGNYYFAMPKANEYAKVVWAVYNETDGAFYLPAKRGSINTQDFKGGFTVDYSMNSTSTPALVNGNTYEFEAVIRETPQDAQQTLQRKAEANTTVSPSSKYVVCPVNLTGDGNIVTEIKEVKGLKIVKKVDYYNMMGVRADSPFGGMNIVVTTYTDGTSCSTKLIR